jgi:hypothetical protein
MRTLVRSVFLSACFSLLLASLASAQSLAGNVRDTSGAVLPGVTVEASSPALIEKVRTAVADGNGQYLITNLPPGNYKVTFSLPGFATVVREGLDLTGAGVTSINAEMRVGSLEESITVTGEAPVVDVQSARQTTVINGDVVRALPASRSYGNYLAAVPAIQATGFNTGVSTTNNFFTARGGRSNEGAIQIDGMNVGSPGNGGGVSGYMYDMNNSAEVQVSISGGLGEADRGAPVFNIIPKTGGNTFSGTYFGSFAGQWGQSSNIDDPLRALGFGDSPALRKNWDNNISVGGPIKRDRIWFYANSRTIGSHVDTQNQYANKNAGNANEWRWVRDESIRVRNATSKLVNSVRLTSQITQKNKVGFFIDYTKNCSASSFTPDSGQCRSPNPDDGWTASGPGIGPGVLTTSPESGSIWNAPSKISQVTWNSPFTNRVLFEAGWSSFWTQWGDTKPEGALSDFIGVTEQSTNAGVPMANYQYRGWYFQPSQDQQHATWRGSLAYVSGSHNFKVGYQGGRMVAKLTTRVGQQLNYIFNNGNPIQLQQRVGDVRVSDRLRYSAIYAQDAWTRGRLTVQGAVRFETASSYSPEGDNGILEDHRFGPKLLFPKVEGVKGYRDITPRVGAAYDVFGTGRTAVKFHLGQYMQGAFSGEVYTINNPAVTLVQTVNRPWTDPNGNRVAECDYLNPAANGECGPWNNLQWGSSVQTTRVNPDVLEGWGVRSRDWQTGISVQQQLLPQVALEVSYNRRWWNNFFSTHNAALTPADFDEVSMTAPRHPDLPNGGGYPISFLVRNNRNPTVGVNDPYYTTNQDFGDETHYWHGVDVSLSARLRGTLFVQAGTSTGRGVNDTCDVVTGRFGRPMTPHITTVTPAIIGEGVINGQPSCDFAEPWLTQLRGLASYTVPKVDVLVSAIFRSQPNAQPAATTVATNGGSRNANFQMTPAQFQAATGVPLRPGLAQYTVNLLAPGALYGERVNVVDMRFAKVVRVGRTRANVGMDLYNLFNANTPTTYEQVYDPATNGARWFQPTAVLNARAARFNVQFDF